MSNLIVKEAHYAKPVLFGISASGILLLVYSAVVSLVSGPGFAREQFILYWYFILSLAISFGVQVGLYTYLRNLIKDGNGGSRVLGVTGTTSTAAMISCCSHYLAKLNTQ